jgi:hypothetical protein
VRKLFYRALCFNFILTTVPASDCELAKLLWLKRYCESARFV